MKKSILTIVILMSGIFAMSQLFTACGGKHESASGATDSTMSNEMKMDSTAMVYACPMHPEITGKEGDTCSKCGMKLEATKSTDSTKHRH